MKRLLFALSAAWLSVALMPAASAQVRLPRLISDGLILQRDAKLPLWGWAAPGEAVTLIFDGKTYKTSTGADGKWQVTMAPHKAGGPFIIDISGSTHLTVQNVLVGDVWLCSGQSNMEFMMGRLKTRFPTVIANSTNPQIRQFKVPMKYVFTGPQADMTMGSWEAANPQSLADFTAVGYFFALSLFEKYHVPIGLINSSVGGSPAEAWMSAEALKAFPNYEQVAIRYADSSALNGTRRRDQAAVASWFTRLRQQDPGVAPGQTPWYAPQTNTTDWKTVPVPARWNEYGGPARGVGWYRKEIDVPAAMVGQPAQLLLGNIVDRDSTYLNGQFVGTVNNRYPLRSYNVPAGLLKAGRNVLVVRVISNTEPGGFVRDKAYQLKAAGQTVELSGNWLFKQGVAAEAQPTATVFQYQPEGLYNGMIAPLLPFALKGVAWYQGESNTGKAAEYQKLFPALIADWRKQWNAPQLPFVYVQLANYMQPKDQPADSRWAELRDVQRQTLAVPNTGMAVAIDVGETNDVHPLDKQTVGQRLALAALPVAYGEKKAVSSGPLYKAMTTAGNKATLTFTGIGKGLEAKGGGELKYFAVAGADKKFVWAQARIEGDKVVVWSEQVSQPVAVRYAWADNPIGANLYNRDGLPASPFRTDN